MATKPANAKQKKWMRDMSDYIQAVSIGKYYGDEYNGCNFQLHHVKGRSAKHNKIAIGHEFIIPVPFDLHDVNSNHGDNVTHHKHKFTDRFGLQSSIFERVFNDMEAYDYDVPSSDILYAIMDTRA